MRYIYVLRLIPRLQDDQAWTSEDEHWVSEHFERLNRDTAIGKVLLAGRTSQTDETGFGIVIFEATSLSEATHYMATDPAVLNGIMTAEIHEFRLALWSSTYQK